MNDLITAPKNEIVVYQPDETMRLEVMLKQDTVWLNRHQLAQLFGRDIKTIGKHIANALTEELAPVVAKDAPTASAMNSASLKDLGTALFAFSKMEIPASAILSRLLPHQT